jgi:hypothetical protein
VEYKIISLLGKSTDFKVRAMMELRPVPGMELGEIIEGYKIELTYPDSPDHEVYEFDPGQIGSASLDKSPFVYEIRKRVDEHGKPMDPSVVLEFGKKIRVPGYDRNKKALRHVGVSIKSRRYLPFYDVFLVRMGMLTYCLRFDFQTSAFLRPDLMVFGPEEPQPGRDVRNGFIKVQHDGWLFKHHGLAVSWFPR